MSWIIAALLCTAAAERGASKISHNSAALDFTYEWPAQSAAIPPLDRQFRIEAAANYRRSLSLGRLDQKLYEQQGRGSVADFYLKKWTSAGESHRLLSLQYQHSAYTGGAHPNTDYGSLIWDRKRSRPVNVSSLFLRPATLERLTRTDYCAALDAERRKRRGKEWKLGLPEFNACPDLSELAIAPVDKDRNGRFDGIDFVASPYTAGPYAEGAYDILLPVTARLIAAMRPEYRNSFERQRQ